MRRYERGIVLLFLAQVLLFWILYRVQAHRRADLQQSMPTLVQIPASLLVQNKSERLGWRDAPYTLVEFGDYQCPACVGQQSVVQQLLEEYPDKLALTFYHFPLTRIHPYAMSCAVISELARAQGLFWQVHEGLYALHGHVAPKQVELFLKRSHLSIRDTPTQLAAARQRVYADIKLAERCHVDSTPTFFLCGPDGRVYRLGYRPTLVTSLMSR